MYSEHHFGKYASSVSLSKILNEFPPNFKWIGKKFCQIYAEYRISQKQFESITDKRTFLLSHLLFRNYALNGINDMMVDNNKIKDVSYMCCFTEMRDILTKINNAVSHFENVICTDYKECLRKRKYI